MSQAFGGSRTLARAPEKGVFPLDHFAECKEAARKYLACLERHEQDASHCMEESKDYLRCRMQRNLMAQQDLKELGLSEGEQQPVQQQR